MKALYSSYAVFLMWLMILTMAMGILGQLLPQLFTLLVLLPYMMAFFLMSKHFLKKQQTLPTSTQRWQLSVGCATLFWLYAIFAGILSLLIHKIQGGTVDLNPLWQALNNLPFVLVFLGMFFMLNSCLVFLGYWFLGKPTEKMWRG